ncbi:MAG: PH domain-containing protein [Polynucleobacter sp.]|nr:MAG: PH domain-containing protein [Polynucleobacter sp.]
MTYVNSVLGKEEVVQYEANVSLMPFLNRFVFGFVLLAGGAYAFQIPNAEKIGGISFASILAISLFLCGLLVLIQPIIAKETTELVITNRRIIAKFGLISRYTIEINLSKVESISVSQSIFGRLLDYGDIEIVGTGGTREPIQFISKPILFRKKVDEILHH